MEECDFHGSRLRTELGRKKLGDNAVRERLTGLIRVALNFSNKLVL